MKKRMIGLGILSAVTLGVLALLAPTTASAYPCVMCKPPICGPCEVYTGDTCLKCGSCVRIKGCHP